MPRRSTRATRAQASSSHVEDVENHDEDPGEGSSRRPTRSARAKPGQQKNHGQAKAAKEDSDEDFVEAATRPARSSSSSKGFKRATKVKDRDGDEDEDYDEDIQDEDPEEDSDFEEPVRKRPKPQSASKPNQKPKRSDEGMKSKDTEVVVDGVVRHGIQVGSLKLTTSRPLADGGQLNEVQKKRLMKLGNYLGYLKNLKKPSGEDTGFSGLRDYRKLPVHFLESYDKAKLGILNTEWFRSHGHVEGLMKRELANFRCLKSVHCFDRRVTAIIWHPSAPHIGIIGDKWGNLKMWNTKEQDVSVQAIGEGAGDAIYGLKYDPLDGLGEDFPWRGLSRRHTTPDSVNFYATGVSGKVTKHRLCPSGMVQSDVLYFTGDSHSVWLTSLDVEPDGNCLWAGDNKGYLMEIDPRLPRNATRPSYRLHKTKISCVQAAPRNPWMLATGSLDSTVKVWDSRMLSDGREMYTLPHDKALGSLRFSRMDGNRLLTTDQHSQLRVYSADTFALETTIAHPHRHFQHLTAIEASWHPLCDLVVVGCYPDPNLPVRQGNKGDVEFFCARTGDLVCSLQDPSSTQIVSLSEFNVDGSRLMISQGMSVKVYGFQPRSNSSKIAPEDMPDGDDHGGPRGGDDGDDDDEDFGSKRKRAPKGKKPASKMPKGKNPNTKTRAPRGKRV